MFRGLLLVFLLHFAFFVSAQPGNRPARRDSTSMRPMPKIGKVYGTVKEAESGSAVPYAAVAVLSLRDSSLAGGGQTNEKGNFLIDELPPGRFILRITFVGFSNQFSAPFSINMQNAEVDAGVIRLQAQSQRLKEVEVSAERSEFINSIDRKVYNVEKNIVNTGGTVTDVLQNIPSVTVDMNGAVGLRGSENVTILIDGKPSGMLGGDRRAVLQQIPASAIEAIEVITNPSARYDADGMAGIINIRTKKDKMKGLNANVSAGIGTNNKYNFTVGGNNRSPRVNLYSNYTFRHETRTNNGFLDQFNYLPGRAPYSYHSNTAETDRNNVHTGRFGADMYLNKYNTLGVNASLTARDEQEPEQIFYVFKYPDQTVFNEYFTNNFGKENNFNYDINTDYKKTWEGSKREWNSTAGFSTNDRNGFTSFDNSLFETGNFHYQISDNRSVYKNVTIQSDLIQPVKSSGKFEAGIKSTNRNIHNDQKFFTLSPTFSGYEFDRFRSDELRYNEQVAAAYSMYSGKWKKLDFNVGLRAEQTFISIESVQSAASIDRDYLSFFPSAFLKYTQQTNEFQFNYSRRINRPDARALNPFADFSDSLNIRRGNPQLNPEFIHSLELSYAKTLKSFNLTTTLYYRHTDDLISRFRNVDPITGIATLMQVNFSSSDNYGLEAIARYSFEKAGSLMASFNIYQNVINGSNVQPELQTDATQWTARLNANLRFGPKTSFQLTGNYIAPIITVNGRIDGMSGVDAGIKQDVMGGKGALALNVTDIFWTRRFHYINRAEYFNSEGERRRESRIATLTFSYRFGNAEQNLFRRKNQRSQDSMQEMIDY